MNLLKTWWLTLVFRVILGAMLLYASFDKIANPSDFAVDIANYLMIPFAFSNLLAIVLPWVELYVGACLLLGIFVDGASLLTMGMMVVFLIALSQATIRGLDIECGCFKGASPIGIRRIFEDIVWLGMAFVVSRRTVKRWEIYPKSV